MNGILSTITLENQGASLVKIERLFSNSLGYTSALPLNDSDNKDIVNVDQNE
jgi:hypothetical protein